MESHKWVFLGGITAAATGALLYVVFGPNQRGKKRRKRDLVPGMENLGNTCFINAILQSLAPCQSVIKWLHEMSGNQTAYWPTQKSTLSKSLLKTLNNLNNINCDNWESSSCSPLTIIKSLQSRGWMIHNEEQDAHEFYHVLTTTLEEECDAQSTTMSLLDVKKLDCLLDAAGHTTLTEIAFRTNSPVKLSIPKFCSSPTKGLLASRLTCESCGFKNPLSYDVFDSISLPIPEKRWGALRLEDCLEQWSSSELVHGVTCESCSKLHSTENPVVCKSTFVKQLKISKLPDCLCFHLVRTVWSGSRSSPSKRFDPVAFPEYLNMDGFLLNINLRRSKPKVILSDFGTYHPGLFGGRIADTRETIGLIEGTSIGGSILSNDAFTRSSCSTAKHVFKLKSAVVHLGNVYSGHFVTYRRGPLHSSSCNDWFYTSDLKTQHCSYSEVFQNTAYMLVYERLTVG